MEIPRIRPRLEVKNEASKDEAELYLYGTITSCCWWDEDVITSTNVRNKLNNIKANKINVHIHSGGGDVFESIAIYNLLKNHDAEIVVYIDGLAASGASIIAMAGDRVIMPRNTMIMIHKAWTYAIGNSDELRKIASDMDKMDTAVKESYKAKFVGTDEELQNLIKDATWLTAEECKTLGFCDELVDEIELPEEENKEINNMTIKESVLAKYNQSGVAVQDKNTPEDKPKNNNANTIKTFLESFN